jgi:hypothetical protein
MTCAQVLRLRCCTVALLRVPSACVLIAPSEAQRPYGSMNALKILPQLERNVATSGVPCSYTSDQEEACITVLSPPYCVNLGQYR